MHDDAVYLSTFVDGPYLTTKSVCDVGPKLVPVRVMEALPYVVVAESKAGPDSAVSVGAA